MDMELDIDKELLEFELESQFSSPVPNPKKRKKIIDLDDLLKDCKKEEEERQKSKSKTKKAPKQLSPYDEDKTEKKLSEAVDDLHELIKEIDGKDNASDGFEIKDSIRDWGLQVFGPEKLPSPLAFPDLGQSTLLQKFMTNKLNSLVEVDMDKVEVFLEGLLLNGWLGNLALKCGHVEESIAIWSFNLLLYSSEESLRLAACDFWHTILLANEVDHLQIKIQWLPNYSQLKTALESFGFLFHLPVNPSSDKELIGGDSSNQGPPSNVRAWIKFVTALCQSRNKHPVISTSQAEELLGTIVFMHLDRRLEGLSVALHECMQSCINSIEEDEWCASCERVSTFLAGRTPKDMNCLRIIQCISGVDSHSKQFRSGLASEILKTCLDQVADVQDIMKMIISINLKDKSCNLFNIYLYLVLVENLLIADNLESKEAIVEMWGSFLRQCCSQISNTNFRPFAQEVRTKASYLLQVHSQQTGNYRQSSLLHDGNVY